MSVTGNRPSIGLVQSWVILLALEAGLIHIYLFLIEGIFSGLAPEEQMGPTYQLLFVGNFFGFVSLATALYLPIPLLARLRPVVRVMLIAMAIASIASYFHVNARDNAGDITQVIEALIIVLVTVDAGMSNPREELAGR